METKKIINVMKVVEQYQSPEREAMLFTGWDTDTANIVRWVNRMPSYAAKYVEEASQIHILSVNSLDNMRLKVGDYLILDEENRLRRVDAKTFRSSYKRKDL